MTRTASSDSRATVAQATASFLYYHGVRRAYGVPGEDHMELLHELAAAGVQYVTARNETSSVLMASAEAARTGVPGLAILTFAPGLTNGMNGIAHAFLDHIPLFVVTGRHPADKISITVRQNLDNRRLVESIVKWSALVGAGAHQVLAKAWDVATEAPGGPVFIELPEEVAVRPAADQAEDWTPHRHPGLRSCEAQDLAGLAKRIAAARHPALILGGHPYDEPDRTRLLRFSEEWRVPTLATPSALGTVPADHPWNAGTFLGSNLERPLLAASDLILAFDLDALDFFNRPMNGLGPLLSIESRPLQQFVFRTEDIISSDVGPFLDGLAVVADATMSEWEVADVASRRQAVADALLVGSGLSVPRAVEVVRKQVPPDALVAVDAGFSKQFIAHLWSPTEPRAYYSAHGLSTMGYAIPAANALKLVEPGRPVIAFMGDGSFLMRATEIGVAAELGLNPIYVVFADQEYTQIAIKQRRRGLQAVGARFDKPSYVALAEALGAEGATASTAEELADAVDAGLARTRPTVIAIDVDTVRNDDLFDLMRG